MNLSLPSRKLLGILLFGTLAPALTPAARADTFDVPIKKRVVNFGLSDSNPPGGTNFSVKLYCDYYSTLMVKEFDDEGKKGAQWLAFLSLGRDTAPPCEKKHAPGEKVLKWPECSGYFRGVKGNLVFFDDADGTDGGMPFRVYDSRTGKLLFEDNGYQSVSVDMKVDVSAFKDLRVDETPGQGIMLRYLRVIDAGCDLHTDNPGCWEEVRKKLRLKSAAPPACVGYDKITSRWESAVAYPVEVSLFPQPVTNTIAGPVGCWPVD